MLPDLPTVAEEISAAYDVTTWYGLFAPATTPHAIIDKVSRSVAKALQDKLVLARLAEFDAEPVGNSPREFDVFLKNEAFNWREVVRAAHVEPQ